MDETAYSEKMSIVSVTQIGINVIGLRRALRHNYACTYTALSHPWLSAPVNSQRHVRQPVLNVRRLNN